MPINVGQLITRNWPVKLAALFFAVMLYVAVAAQQPITQSFALQLAVVAPPGRAIHQDPTEIWVLLSGRGGELLKVRSLPRVITKTVPDTFAGSLWHIRLPSVACLPPPGTVPRLTSQTSRSHTRPPSREQAFAGRDSLVFLDSYGGLGGHPKIPS